MVKLRLNYALWSGSIGPPSRYWAVTNRPTFPNPSCPGQFLCPCTALARSPSSPWPCTVTLDHKNRRKMKTKGGKQTLTSWQLCIRMCITPWHAAGMATMTKVIQYPFFHPAFYSCSIFPSQPWFTLSYSYTRHSRRAATSSQMGFMLLNPCTAVH